jgi:hypothetical protein
LVALWGGKRSKDETLTSTATTGWTDTESDFRAVACSVPEVFLQQSCEAGISICPQSLFIMRQHARSSTVISASGAIQAIAGATQDTSSSKTAPN